LPLSTGPCEDSRWAEFELATFMVLWERIRLLCQRGCSPDRKLPSWVIFGSQQDQQIQKKEGPCKIHPEYLHLIWVMLFMQIVKYFNPIRDEKDIRNERF